MVRPTVAITEVFSWSTSTADVSPMPITGCEINSTVKWPFIYIFKSSGHSLKHKSYY